MSKLEAACAEAKHAIANVKVIQLVEQLEQGAAEAVRLANELVEIAKRDEPARRVLLRARKRR